MSPEQITGEPLDGRSDIFSLGVVLWELCAGAPLWSGDNPGAVSEQVKNARVEPPSKRARDVPAELDRICMKALAHGRDARYGRAADLARELSTCLAQLAPALTREDVAAYMQEVVPRPDAEPKPMATAATVPGGALLAEIAPSGLAPLDAYAATTPSPQAAGNAAATRPSRPAQRTRTPIALGVAAVLLVGGGLAVRHYRHALATTTINAGVDAAPLPLVDAGPALPKLSDAQKLRLQAELEALPRAGSTWRGVPAEDYVTVLSAVDAALCLTPQGATEPIVPAPLRARVDAQQLWPETRAVAHYLDAAGELPPKVAGSLQAFVRTHPAWAPGAAGWSLARVAALARPDDATLQLALIRQNGALGLWRSERGGETLPHPDLCERSAAVHRYAAMAPGPRAQMLERFLAALPPELPADADGLRYTLGGAERDDAAATLLLRLRVTNSGDDDKTLELASLRLVGLDAAPEIDPPAQRLGPGLSRDVRLTFANISDELAEAAVLIVPRAPGQHVDLQAYSEDLK
jgi:hypothetical protein